MAGGGAADQRHTAVKIRHFTRYAAGTECTQRTGVGIYNRHADRRARDQPHFAGGARRQAMTERFAHGFHVATNFLRIVLQQILKPYFARK
ncbi:MAG: hypothetical protein K0R86_2728 [Enterobacter kobei]|nr:hypothetical protein [Enterobacter kobei]